MPHYGPLDRRGFLRVSFAATGGLLIGVYLAGCSTEPAPLPGPTDPPNPTDIPASPTAAAAQATAVPPTVTIPAAPTVVAPGDPNLPFQPNLFVGIDPDGAVTLTIHRSEMGQGVRTALAMVLAEELEVDWASVRIEQSPASAGIGDQITGGSGSISGHYARLRGAGAAARQILIAAAAQRWGVAPEECTAELGAVVHSAGGKRLGYGELVGIARQIELPAGPPPLKNPRDFRLIGTSVPRIDGPDIVAGKAIYGLDIRLPGMLFAVVARCPVPGGTVAGYDATRAERVAGVRAVVSVPSGIAVVAEHTWAAIQGRDALEITWDEGKLAEISSEAVRARLAALVEEAVAKETATADSILEAIYETPYLAHVPMEPVNCVADVRGDSCEIWSPTQNPQEVQRYVRNSVGVSTTVHVTLIGGGFGRRLEVDYAIEAAQVSKVVGAPVQVVWTREDDIRHDFYRQPTYHWLRAGWDSAGKLTLWRHLMAGPGLNGIAYTGGTDVLEEGLDVAYAISDRRSRVIFAPISVPTGPWRAVMNGPNTFANECAIDEVASALQQDPFAFRMALLRESDPLRPVVELAATQADWGMPMPKGHGRGMACFMYRQTAVAMVAEVEALDGAVRVLRVVCAINCGTVVNPDMVVQQIEGAVADGLMSLLKAEITFEQGRVQQGNFDDHPLLRIGEMPQVDVHIMPDTRPPQGVGEMGVPTVVPAVVNAIFDATGKRIRRIPIRAAS